MKLRFFVSLLLFAASAGSTPAITITNKVVTDDLFSFDFSGIGISDSISTAFGYEGPWVVGSESHFGSLENYAFFLGAARKGFDVGLYTGNVPIGESFLVSTSIEVPDGVDTYLFKGFVDFTPSDGWGKYSGSFLATHTAKVADGGNVGWLCGMVLAGVCMVSRGRSPLPLKR